MYSSELQREAVKSREALSAFKHVAILPAFHRRLWLRLLVLIDWLIACV
jgi:hypothetical protein